MAIPIVNSRDLPNTWRILDDKLGNFRDRGLPFKFPYVGAYSQSLAEWFVRVYSAPGDTVFDPFCVCENSKILLGSQEMINIQDIYNRKDNQKDIFGKSKYIDNVISFNIDNDNKDDKNLIVSSPIENFFTKDNDGIDIYEIYTRNRRRLKASGSHVFLTKIGNKLEWRQLKDLKFGDMVAVYPQVIHLDDNVEREETILTEQDIIDNIPDHTIADKILYELKCANVIPLTNKNPKLHIIARLCGFLMTDGCVSEHEGCYSGDYKGERFVSTIVFISGNKYSLINIYNDIKSLGFDLEERISEAKERSNPGINWGKTRDLRINSKSIYVLFKALGMPSGKKPEKQFNIPRWIYYCSKKVKQEFLAGIFGGDGGIVYFENIRGKIAPKIRAGGFGNSKISELEHSLEVYISEIISLLKEFGIECGKTSVTRRLVRKDGKESVTYYINLSDTNENALKFLRYIGYGYDNYKMEKTFPIYEYLLSRNNRIGIKASIRSINIFPDYNTWERMYVLDGIVLDDVISIKKTEYKGKLYDLFIENAHNYVVNEFVTHNSGRGTTAMQALWTGRNMITNDLSPYSHTLCHSVMFVPYMRDVIIFIKNLEEYINSDRCKISKDYAGKGSEDDAAKLYHEGTFDQIIKLRNILKNRDILLGFGDDLFKDINYRNNLKGSYTYRHEVVMFTRMVMSQLMLHSSQDMSFNGIKTRGTDNTYIRGILKYYTTLGESPKRVNIFENMRHYVEKMGLDELGVRDKFIKLERKMFACDARRLDLLDKCVDIVVTSPPYYANLNYGMANWLRIWSIGGIGDPLIENRMNPEIMDIQNNSEIYGKTYDRITDKAGGTVDNPMSYSNFTGWYLKELNRILKDDGVAIVVVGDYGNKRKVEAWRLVTDRAEIFGFKPQTVIMDELNKQTKSSTQFQAKHDGGKNDMDVCVILFKGKYQRKNNPEDIDFRWGARFNDSRQLSIDTAWG